MHILCVFVYLDHPDDQGNHTGEFLLVLGAKLQVGVSTYARNLNCRLYDIPSFISSHEEATVTITVFIYKNIMAISVASKQWMDIPQNIQILQN